MNTPPSNQDYENSIVFDALNTSNWESSNVYDSLSEGNITAINATIVIWENYQQTIQAIQRWQERFTSQSDTIMNALPCL